MEEVEEGIERRGLLPGGRRRSEPASGHMGPDPRSLMFTGSHVAHQHPRDYETWNAYEESEFGDDVVKIDTDVAPDNSNDNPNGEPRSTTNTIADTAIYFANEVRGWFSWALPDDDDGYAHGNSSKQKLAASNASCKSFHAQLSESQNANIPNLPDFDRNASMRHFRSSQIGDVFQKKSRFSRVITAPFKHVRTGGSAKENKIPHMTAKAADGIARCQSVAFQRTASQIGRTECRWLPRCHEPQHYMTAARIAQKALAMSRWQTWPGRPKTNTVSADSVDSARNDNDANSSADSSAGTRTNKSGKSMPPRKNLKKIGRGAAARVSGRVKNGRSNSQCAHRQVCRHPAMMTTPPTTLPATRRSTIGKRSFSQSATRRRCR